MEDFCEEVCYVKGWKRASYIRGSGISSSIGILFERKGECIIFLENFYEKEIYCMKGWEI